jgi:hypothetical protein
LEKAMFRNTFHSVLIAVFMGITLLGSALFGLYLFVPDHSSRLGAIEARLDDVAMSLDGMIVSRAKVETTPATSFSADLSNDSSTLRTILDRLDALERQMYGVREPRLGTVDPDQTLPTKVAELLESGELAITALSSPQTIMKSFSSQDASSSWGDDASAAITKAYMTEFPRGDFFMKYGGEVSADCRQSVCRLDLELNPSVAQLDPFELAEIFQRGEFELMALSRDVGDAGSMVVEVQRTPTPMISLYLEQRPSASAHELSVPAARETIK